VETEGMAAKAGTLATAASAEQAESEARADLVPQVALEVAAASAVTVGMPGTEETVPMAAMGATELLVAPAEPVASVVVPETARREATLEMAAMVEMAAAVEMVVLQWLWIKGRL
jgi:hypothetical protein